MSLGLTLYLAAAQRAGARTLQLQGHNKPAHPARPDGKLVWLHVSSDEEVTPVQVLIRHMAETRDEVSFLVTTLPDAKIDAPFQDFCFQPCIHLPAPEDTPQQTAHFLNHWHPNVAVWAGSLLRPALIVQTAACSIPLFMVDARKRAAAGASKLWGKGVVKSVLGLFDHILASKAPVAVQLAKQGILATKTEACGLMDEGLVTPFCDDRDRDAMAQALAARPVWLAAYTLKAEDEIVVAAHRAASRLSHRLLLILLPKSPGRGKALAQSLISNDWIIAQRSLDQEPEENVQILIADTEDEIGLWLRLAPVCFLGNSLTKKSSGSSPFGASALGSAILYGPHVRAFESAYALLDAAGAARKIHNAAELATGVQDLLAPDKAAEMAHAGWEISSRGAKATNRAIALIEHALDRRENA